MSDRNKIWGTYTSKEEYNPIIKDQWNRTPYYLSSNRNIFEPVVSRYLFEKGFTPKYPDGKKFAACLTHDIDFLYENKSFRRVLKDEAKSLTGLRFNDSLKILRDSIKKRIHPDWHINKILKCEKNYNAKSTFYFLAITEKDSDFNYDINKIKDIFDEIEFNNCEIGLHGSQSAYNNLNQITEEKDRLEKQINKRVNGYRNHILRFEIPLTWELLNKAGFKYDTTFGYADCVGFRNGMCYPYKPYNKTKQQFIDIFELPLTLMDVTLFNYMKLNYKEAFKICKIITDRVEYFNGVLNIIWHNNSFTGELGNFYNALLKYLLDKNAWLTTCNEIVDWWLENNYLESTQNILTKLTINENQ